MNIFEFRKKYKNSEQYEVIVLADEEATNERIDKLEERGFILEEFNSVMEWVQSFGGEWTDGELLDLLIDLADRKQTEYEI